MDKTCQALVVLVYQESAFLIKYLKSSHGLTTLGFSHTDVIFHLPITSCFCFLMKLVKDPELKAQELSCWSQKG